MDRRKILVSIIICTCMALTACGGSATEGDNETVGGVSGSAVSGTAVSDASDVTVPPEKVPDKWKARGYLMNAAFRIKERTPEGYRGEVVISDPDVYETDYPNWEICLELEDEIVETSGAEIVSREGELYTIRGTGDNRDCFEDTEKLRFEITVRCPGGAHEPGLCYWKRKNADVPDKNYKFEVLELEAEKKEVHGKLRFTNCSEESFDHWIVRTGSNFKIESVSGARIFYEDGYEDYEDEEGEIWDYSLCGEGENLSLAKGESIEISFMGKCKKGKPEIGGAVIVESGQDTQINWGVIENNYGAKYGKIEKYLVADSVNSVDLFFVFDEKGEDSYTATAELTNLLDEYEFSPEKYEDSELTEWLEISDWEICLECEDTIEEIEGAEITAHEGNVYHIRAADKDKWIPCCGMETFQVKVSCQEQIHHLGKVYLAKARYRGEGISSEDKQKELDIDEKDLAEATGVQWLGYQDFYEEDGVVYDSDDFDTLEEYTAYEERVKWGKKMGR